MKFVVALSLAFLFLLFPLQVRAADGAINVSVTGLKNARGMVRIALFNAPDGFEDKHFAVDKAFKTAVAPIKDNNNECTCTLTSVPKGEYAIRLFHDQENVGKLETNMLGIPRNPYGFSNNPGAKFGPASFEKSKFQFDGTKLDMTIKMQHPGL